MLKVILIVAVLVALSAAVPISTPLLGKLIPQPAEAPANTQHAGYVAAYTPIIRSTAYVAPLAYATIEHVPHVYAKNYLTYTAPISAAALAAGPLEPAAYHIAY